MPHTGARHSLVRVVHPPRSAGTPSVRRPRLALARVSRRTPSSSSPPPCHSSRCGVLAVALTSGADACRTARTPVTPILPDLAMSPLTDVTSGVAIDGKQYVELHGGDRQRRRRAVHRPRRPRRPSAGAGGSRSASASTTRSTSEAVTPGTMVFGGHGHDHWHVQLGASYWLTRPASSEVLRRYVEGRLLLLRPASASRRSRPTRRRARSSRRTTCNGRDDARARRWASRPAGPTPTPGRSPTSGSS